jgi:surface polysaccharide O-acyltransferase-like enzyme
MASANRETGASRLWFVQWLRVLLTVLVVAHHSAEPYVAVGGDWSDIVSDPAKSGRLMTLFVFNRTFFMGFFFLISACFLDASLARHGALGVVRNRLIRLGIPLVVIVVFVFGSIGYAVYGEGQGYLTFLVRDYLGRGNAEFGHLWFIAHLLVYILLYVALRAVVPGLGTWGRKAAPPGNGAILGYVLAIGAVEALVRQVWPIDTWVRFFGLIPGEPAHMPFYVTLFGIGVLAGRAGWLTRLEERVAVPWAVAGLAIFLALAVPWTPRLAQPDTATMRIGWAFLEPVVGVGTMLGLVVLFRRFLSGRGPVLRFLEGNVYGVYLVHLFVVIALQAALVGADWPALAKFCVVLAGTLIVALPVVALLRAIPVVRRVI